MRKNGKYMLFIYALLLWINFPAFAQEIAQKGDVIESLSMPSKILNGDLKYSVYLPSGYSTSKISYPVLYLLHGYTDNETAWIRNGSIDKTADKLISTKETVPMVIIMPDAGLSWYINSYDGKFKYEDAFFKEFIPFIEKTYRINSSKKFRAIGGLSMGGYGALLYSLKHPDLFSVCMPFSAAIRNDSLMLKRLQNGESNSNVCYGFLNGGNLPVSWKPNSVLDLANTTSVSQLQSVDYYIDCGDKDELSFGNSLLHFIFMDRKIKHEFRIREGQHNWDYWQKSIEDGLKYLAPRFH